MNLPVELLRVIRKYSEPSAESLSEVTLRVRTYSHSDLDENIHEDELHASTVLLEQMGWQSNDYSSYRNCPWRETEDQVQFGFRKGQTSFVVCPETLTGFVTNKRFYVTRPFTQKEIVYVDTDDAQDRLNKSGDNYWDATATFPVGDLHETPKRLFGCPLPLINKWCSQNHSEPITICAELPIRQMWSHHCDYDYYFNTLISLEK